MRQKIVEIAKSWLGSVQGGAGHKSIIDTYNNHKPLARNYKVTYTDAWCATTVSALFIKAGCPELFPLECSCYYVIENAKKMGIWVEDDNYLPSPGDSVLYDWQDNGVGDNKGTPDHIGVVVSVSGNEITVIEGNKNKSVGYRTINRNGRYIRGYVTPKFTEEKQQQVTKPVTSNTTNKNIKAVDYATKFNPSIAGTYVCGASELNVRDGAGTNKGILTTITRGTEVKNYGYYTPYNGSKWLLIEFIKNGVKYIGFASEGATGGYLRKK